MSETDAFERVESESNRNGIQVSCEIINEHGSPNVICFRVETLGDLMQIEGDIRDRISIELNKCIRALG